MAQKGINKVILIGNLGSDPELKQMNNGGSVVNVSLATSESWKDKATGENKDKTEWHKLVLYNKIAEILAQYCKKGSKIYIEGSLATKEWLDKEQQKRYTTEINVKEIVMLDSKNESNEVKEYDPSDRSDYKYNAHNDKYKTSNRNDEDDIPF